MFRFQLDKKLPIFKQVHKHGKLYGGWCQKYLAIFSILFLARLQNRLLQYDLQPLPSHTARLHLPKTIGKGGDVCTSFPPTCYASVNSSSAHPSPGNSGAFSHTFHPRGWALAFHPITPGHLTISLLSHHNIVISFNDHFIGKYGTFLLEYV